MLIVLSNLPEEADFDLSVLNLLLHVKVYGVIVSREFVSLKELNRGLV